MEANGTEETNQSLNIDDAIVELRAIINNSADTYHRLKRVKFDYLTQICELYSRIDFPSIMMESFRKEINHSLPSAKDLMDGN